MKCFGAGLLIVTSCLTGPAFAVDFWHSSTVWAGQGECSATFVFDSGFKEIENLRVTVTAVDQKGKEVASGVLEVPKFGQSSSDRFADAFLEGEGVCDDNLTIVVKEATAIVDGKRTDLLKSKTLSTRDFKPFKIRIENEAGAGSGKYPEALPSGVDRDGGRNEAKSPGQRSVLLSGVHGDRELLAGPQWACASSGGTSQAGSSRWVLALGDNSTFTALKPASSALPASYEDGTYTFDGTRLTLKVVNVAFDLDRESASFREADLDAFRSGESRIVTARGIRFVPSATPLPTEEMYEISQLTSAYMIGTTRFRQKRRGEPEFTSPPFAFTCHHAAKDVPME